jgi:hypothetical protein
VLEQARITRSSHRRDLRWIECAGMGQAVHPLASCMAVHLLTGGAVRTTVSDYSEHEDAFTR